jgi:5-methylthioribose kinase
MRWRRERLLLCGLGVLCGELKHNSPQSHRDHREEFTLFELTPDNAVEYLRSRQWVGAGEVRVTPLGWGVSNLVLRVETAERAFVLKQSRPQLRTRDAWFSDLNRVYREQEVMELLFPLLPPPTVPEVLFSDRDNYVFAMSHAPFESKVWKESLLAGDVDLAIAERCGMILGKMHERTARGPAAHAARLAFGDLTVFVQLRIDPFYRRVQERRPEVARPIEPIIEQMYEVKEALCHGDYTPKNILTHSQGFTLVDYETAHFGDPTMDIGLFLAHLLLKAAASGGRPPPVADKLLEATQAFWRGYEREATFKPIADLQRRGIQHLAVCLLARIDGTSPVDYLPEEGKRESIRRIARLLLEEHSHEWNRVIALFQPTGLVPG